MRNENARVLSVYEFIVTPPWLRNRSIVMQIDRFVSLWW